MEQELVWTITVVLMAAATGVFIWVASSGGPPCLRMHHPAIAVAYRLRPWLFGLVTLILDRRQLPGDRSAALCLPGGPRRAAAGRRGRRAIGLDHLPEHHRSREAGRILCHQQGMSTTGSRFMTKDCAL